MGQVISLAPDERVGLDPEQVEGLFGELGRIGAENVLCRALGQLVLRLEQADRSFERGDFDEMLKNVRRLGVIAEQIGLTSLSDGAATVLYTIDQGDRVATAATFARLLRIGRKSMAALWDLRVLSD